MTDVAQTGLVVLFLFLSGVFSATETAVTSLDEMRQEHMRQRPHMRRFLRFLNEPFVFLMMILILNTFVGVGVSFLLQPLLERFFPGVPALALSLVVTSLLLLFGEVTPKFLALSKPNQLLSVSLWIVMPFFYVFEPLVRPLARGLEGLMQKLDRARKPANPEGKHLMAISHVLTYHNFLQDNEKDLISGVLHFAQREAWNVMTPRNKVYSIETTTPIADAIQYMTTANYSKLPVYADSEEEIIGVVFSVDLFSASQVDLPVEQIMRAVHYIPEHKSLAETFQDALDKDWSIAVVIDEYGSALGIVTMNDLLSDIVGGLMDEGLDEAHKIVPISATRFLVEGDISLIEFNEYFGVQLDSEAETLAGYLIEQHQDIPPLHETFEIQNLSLLVRVRTNTTVSSVLVQKVKTA